MKLFIPGAIAILTLSLSAWAQDPKKPDDILQKRDGGLVVGRVLKMDADAIDFQVTGEKEPRRIALRDLMPYSVYRLRLDRIDKKSGQARMDLAEFCMSNGLYSTAVREFEEAAAIDASLADKAKKRRDEAHNEDGRSKFEDVKKLHLRKEYEEAKNIVRLLIDKYGDTPYAEEAKKEDVKMAEEIAKENADKKAQLLAQQQAAADAGAKKVDDQNKATVARTVELLEEAQKAWAEGLDHDGKNLTKADKAWKAAEVALLGARRNLESLLKSNDVAVLQKAKDLEKQTDLWQAKVYYRLGRMWAVELAYPTALEWLNKAMKVPHDEQMDHLINDLTLTISQLQMRQRAVGRGY
jgi:tetratricopeptide (TPR) repeat protein